MKRASRIFNWLAQVNADRSLRNSTFKVAHALANKTNDAEFNKSDRLVTWQSIPTLINATGLCDRTVRYGTKLLEKTGHIAVDPGHGPRRSNRYTLILQKRQTIASLTEAISGKPLPHSVEQKRQSGTPIAANIDTSSGNPMPPNYSINNFSNFCSPNLETEDASRGPRGLEGLGALGALEPDLRRRLGDDFKWLAMARLEALTENTVTLSVLTASQRDAIQKHCEADILAAAGVTKLDFVVEIATEPRHGRRGRHGCALFRDAADLHHRDDGSRRR
jgi:hypothetical protein